MKYHVKSKIFQISEESNGKSVDQQRKFVSSHSVTRNRSYWMSQSKVCALTELCDKKYAADIQN